MTEKFPGFEHETNWCAVTGAPSSGKTSVIEELAHRGFAVQNEVARELIETALRHGKTLQQVRDTEHVQQLQKRILRLKLAREKGLNRETLVFTDRGLPDSIIYFRRAGLDPAEAIRDSKLFHYRAVFLFERLPLVKDGVRTENEQDLKDIEAEIENDYRDLGYDPIRVPVLPIARRADFILGKLGIAIAA
jgi:predicted ATPase